MENNRDEENREILSTDAEKENASEELTETQDISAAQNESGEKEEKVYAPKYAKESKAEGIDFYGTPKEPNASFKRVSRGFVIFSYIAVMILSMLVGGAITYFFIPKVSVKTEAAVTEDSEKKKEKVAQKTVEEYPSSMPDIGGELPVIEDERNPIPDIVEQLADAVVRIKTQEVTVAEEEDPVVTDISGGSGFIISESGYIVTNYHVIKKGSQIIVTDEDGMSYDAALVGYNAEEDIAVIKIDTKRKLTALPIGNSNALRVGEQVIAIGSPYGIGTLLQGSVTVGYVSAIDRELIVNEKVQTYIQTDAALNIGNSGGPLLNTKGELIGINTLKSASTVYSSDGGSVENEGIGFAIPISRAMDTIKSIILNGTEEKPGIGIYYYELSEEQCEELGIDGGCIIDSFMDVSSAKQAGMLENDIIIACDGKKTDTSDVIKDIVSGKNVGDKIIFTVLRDGEEQEITVEIINMNV